MNIGLPHPPPRRPPKIHSLRLNIVDFTSADFFQPPAQPQTATNHPHPTIHHQKRKSLFQIYKQRNRKSTKSKFSRLQTDLTLEEESTDQLSRPYFSNKKDNLQNVSPKIQYQQFFDKEWHVETRLVLLREKILDNRMPSINIRKLVMTDIASKEEQMRRLSRNREKIVLRRKAPETKSVCRSKIVLKSQEKAPKVQKIQKTTIQSKPRHTITQSPSLTPWLSPNPRILQLNDQFF